VSRLRWRWRRWRARHYLWLAELAWYNRPNDITKEGYYRARNFLAHVEAARP
jgi:hypothetical protein